ncbi:AraC family transcriptional regulator [Aggregicoccus sp. 17bor-14]|uniref:AraC family transcriptional regulator n=1 Tax=Myxococcaceae TaxID=31 RepID=UPI00129C7C99|nr:MULTISPECIES: AraC family transcriptional regulator [Myxococcaceae]MBF5043328.1 AraC family transcriptional regulator [Simulacricoccus sp. 17bor-14]MRI89087.1 AraC family transcriptional regulator [Aggregicoccus sp. 17bor-14]
MDGAPTPDLLGQLLERTRLRGQLYCRTVARAPWGLRFPPTAVATLHLVTAGRGCLVQGREVIALGTGDVVLLPRGEGHAVADSPRTPKLPLEQWLAERGDAPVHALGGSGAESRFLCGHFAFEEPGVHPVMRLLPERVHLRGDSEAVRAMGPTVALLEQEYERAERGATVVASRLLDVLLVQVLRAWADAQPVGGAGWLGALGDRSLASALGWMHAEPGRDWSVEELARRSGTSRATLARRFAAELGMAPHAYLTQLRMQEAAAHLRRGDEGLAAVAARVGYDSEFAFNRAFRRHMGMPPGAFRRSTRS